MSSAAEDLREVGPWGQAATLAFRFLFLSTWVIVAGWFVSNFHQIPPDSQAVVMRFGTVARVSGSGLLLAWPRPIERVVVLPGPARQIQLPIRQFVPEKYLYNRLISFSATDTSRSYELSNDARYNTGFLLTGDMSVVHLDAQLVYQITDPAAYMVAYDHVEPALERLMIASAVSIAGSRDLDSILVARPEAASRSDQAARRESLRTDLMEAVNKRLEVLTEQGAGLGVAISRVDLIPSIPVGAKFSFDNVLVVSQRAEADVAAARTRAQVRAQEADAQSDRIAAGATAAAEETETAAKTQTASIAALARQTQDMSRGMQLTKLYYDRVKSLLKQAGSVDVLDNKGTVRAILPEGNTGASQ